MGLYGSGGVGDVILRHTYLHATLYIATLGWLLGLQITRACEILPQPFSKINPGAPARYEYLVFPSIDQITCASLHYSCFPSVKVKLNKIKNKQHVEKYYDETSWKVVRGIILSKQTRSDIVYTSNISPQST